MDFDNLYKNLVPTNARLYLESLLGKESSITEKDFTTEQLNLLKNIVQSRKSNQVTYSDYTLFPDLNNWTSAAKKSFTDPEFNIATSLGNFGVRDLGDSYEAYDKYNWNGDFDKPIKTLSDLFKYTSFSRPTEVLNGFAELYGSKNSRDVKIKIPK